MLKLWLPFPPSANGLYPGTTRRFKSQEYKEWVHAAGLILNQQKKENQFTEPVQITYRLGKPNKRRMDLANREKALSDLLVAHKILSDDSLIHKLFMEWAEITGVEVIIESLKTVEN